MKSLDQVGGLVEEVRHSEEIDWKEITRCREDCAALTWGLDGMRSYRRGKKYGIERQGDEKTGFAARQGIGHDRLNMSEVEATGLEIVKIWVGGLVRARWMLAVWVRTTVGALGSTVKAGRDKVLSRGGVRVWSPVGRFSLLGFAPLFSKGSEMGDPSSSKNLPEDRPAHRFEGSKKIYKKLKTDDAISTITEDSFILFRKKFHFPNDVVMKVPARSDRARFPPPGYVTVYELSLRAGLRLPPAPELIDILTICGAEKPLQSNLFLPFSPLHDDGREPFFLPSAENRNSSLFHHSTVMAENHSSSLFHHSTVKAENLASSLFHHSTVKAENLASSLFHHSTVKAENLASSLFHHSTVKAENLGKH
ncbi:hypothetical protein M5K25_001818 [Dendrobium thyrsiflorum]|uniref:Uncharacterized protein n=1 Tax=Dendrobium thyrsiflorum TaxID=117978 RepID=A0ABD0VZT2_DENTH